MGRMDVREKNQRGVGKSGTYVRKVLQKLEKLKHKKKRLVQSPDYFLMDVKSQGCFNMFVYAILIAEMLMYEKNDRVQPLSDHGGVPRLGDGALPAYRRKGEAH
uniref:40S ribosomal protein S27 n=1 Tax=Aegilops tauschii TaxID=37682 RepID=M8BIC3_AEGTA